jgi:hypothetical protein
MTSSVCGLSRGTRFQCEACGFGSDCLLKSLDHIESHSSESDTYVERLYAIAFWQAENPPRLAL